MAGEPDGTLFDWREIAERHSWEALLLGNGLSINVWEPFGYRQLYDWARQEELSPQDRELFASTPNFERVLGDLLTAARVNEAYGVATEPGMPRPTHEAISTHLEVRPSGSGKQQARKD